MNLKLLTSLILLSSISISVKTKSKKHSFFTPTEKRIITMEELQENCKTIPFLLVFYKNSTADSKNLEIIFKKTAKNKFKFAITFAILDVSNFSSEILNLQGVKNSPSLFFFVKNHKKHYVGDFKTQTLTIWIKEIFEAKPVSKKSKLDIDHIDKHYFVFVPSRIIKKKKSYFDILAKLISPLRIYTGFNQTELRNVFKKPHLEKSAFVYREYGNEITKLNISMPLELLAHEITTKEFPTFAKCDENSYRFFVEFKIPILVFYSTDKNDPKWEMVKSIAKNYSEYLMPVLVDTTKNDICNQFATKFLDVKKSPSLRILNLTKKVKRFKFVGDFDSEHVNFFLTNYISGNLKSHSLNQKLAKNDNVKGIPSGNYFGFKKAVENFSHRYLIYIYDPFVSDLESDLAVLKSVQKKLQINRSFKILAIDHFKNDIDGHFNAQMPLVFLILRKGKFALYEKGKLTRAGLLELIKRHLPALEIEKEIDTDL